MTLGYYLQCDVGPRPVLQVGELQVRVPIHKVDAEQLLTLRAPKTWEALAQGPAALSNTAGPILALDPFAWALGSRRTWRGLTELSTEKKGHESENRVEERGHFPVLWYQGESDNGTAGELPHE